MPTRRKRPQPSSTERPELPPVDPLASAHEAMHHAQEGNVKLARSVDILRTGLEAIVMAEWDHRENRPPSPTELRALAIKALDTYSQHIGQSWRKNPIIGSYAGDKSDALGYT
jgi:hypothetical protein